VRIEPHNRLAVEIHRIVGQNQLVTSAVAKLGVSVIA
jgi:hypothetical protein